MRRCLAVCAALTVAAGAGVLSSPVLQARAATVFTVTPGHSIQAAINGASPGDTIHVTKGTYTEYLLITTNGLRLTGDPGTVLMPPGSPTPCPLDAAGICALFVDGLHIDHMTVTGFPGEGVLLFEASSSEVDHSVLSDNGGYGLFAFRSSKGHYHHNTAFGNEEAGIYVGESPNTNTTVDHNTSYQNGFGLFLRSDTHAIASNNTVHDNCVGILLLNDGSTGDGTTPIGDSFWTIDHNTVNHNDAACPAGEGPALSGIGIGVAGATSITLDHNAVTNNVPSGDTAFSGGMVFVPTVTAESDNTASHNQLSGNSPADILVGDAGTGDSFVKNQCAGSIPPGLC